MANPNTGNMPPNAKCQCLPTRVGIVVKAKVKANANANANANIAKCPTSSLKVRWEVSAILPTNMQTAKIKNAQRATALELRSP